MRAEAHEAWPGGGARRGGTHMAHGITLPAQGGRRAANVEDSRGSGLPSNDRGQRGQPGIRHGR